MAEGQPIEKAAANAAQSRDGNPPKEPTAEELDTARLRIEQLSENPVEHYAAEAAANITESPRGTAHGQYMKAQTAFIRAQTTFIHHPKDLATFMWAQLNYMEALAALLSERNLPHVVSTQEGYINHFHNLLEEAGVI